MICPNCGKQVDDGAKFCRHCGASLDEGTAYANKTASKQTEKREEDLFGFDEKKEDDLFGFDDNKNASDPFGFGEKKGADPFGFDSSSSGAGQDPFANNAQNYSRYGRPAADPNDKKSFGFGLLSFLIPLAGFILWLVWRDKMPKRARSCAVGAIIGVVVYVLSVILEVILSAAIYGFYLY